MTSWKELFRLAHRTAHLSAAVLLPRLLLWVLLASTTSSFHHYERIITPPPLLRVRDDSVETRTDFVGYELGFDNTCGSKLL